MLDPAPMATSNMGHIDLLFIFISNPSMKLGVLVTSTHFLYLEPVALHFSISGLHKSDTGRSHSYTFIYLIMRHSGIITV